MATLNIQEKIQEKIELEKKFDAIHAKAGARLNLAGYLEALADMRKEIIINGIFDLKSYDSKIKMWQKIIKLRELLAKLAEVGK